MHLQNRFYRIIIGTASQHAPENELGTFKQLIIVDIVDGQFQELLLLIVKKQGWRLFVIMLQEVDDAITRRETVAQDAAHAG